MGRNYRSCAVPGCLDTHSTRHRFPNPHKDRKRYNIWVEVIKNSTVNILDPQRVFANYRVCHQHFTINDISSNMYLVKTAVPTQKLPPATGPTASASTSSASTASASTASASIASESTASESTASASTVSESTASASTASALTASASTIILPVTGEELFNPYKNELPLIMQGCQYSPPRLSMPLIIRPAQLTPKAKYLYKQVRNLKKD